MKKTFKYLISVVIVLLFSTAIYVYWQLSSSQPKLNGQVESGVSELTLVTRDQQGIPQITAKNRLDVSYALGYLHGQERFFQMALLRRNSAGELSELFGKLALSHDKRIRIHQFRKRVNEFVQRLPQHHKMILESYTQGVNKGLSELNNFPFEYIILDTAPKPWLPQDSMLVLYSIYVDLQDEFGNRERTLGALRDLLPEQYYNFLTPAGSQWDSAIDGSNLKPSPIPQQQSNFPHKM